MTGNQAREIFIKYFEKHNHKHVRSSGLVPKDDPTLLFVNAGMVQFKRVFTGDEKKEYSTAVTAQKCVRAGGKHNDLENVGYTARHHTFFEMLGNFSFGDYFKEKAIEFAWDLLTNGYGFKEDKLWVSVFHEDDEAYNIWKNNIKVPEQRIVKLGEEDNFWAMGDTGPCGPCSEIHIDRGKEFGCEKKDCAIGCDCDRWLELWNLVFMQFEKDEAGNMKKLPTPSIDTGLGLERIVSVLQGVPTNFDTDLFIPIMEKAEKLSQKKRTDSKQTEVAIKVIADHSRASAFLICDGVMPSNEGRGYVLRRIMRRAIRYGKSINLEEPFLHKTVKMVFKVMEKAYPELEKSSAFILNVVINEEKQFRKTLDLGLKLLETSLSEIKKQNKEVLSGDIIFKLYDTFGFPVDIIADHIKDKSVVLDMQGFDRAMAEQKARSKPLKQFAGLEKAYKNLISQGVKTFFEGYDKIKIKAKVLFLVKDGKEIQTANQNDIIEIITDSTVFYAQAGGQAADTGVFENGNCLIEIFDTIKDPSGIIIHKAKIKSGQIKRGEKLWLIVDEKKRESTARNHTATHILHWALRKVLGDHVKQAGSLVNSERLRFDFTHFEGLNLKDTHDIESKVNSQIQKNHLVITKEMNMDQALKSGAIALFEEKYSDIVRVVSQGDFSVELCGGTHTKQSGNIGLLKILSEQSIASGVRRIEAVTGQKALDLIHKDQLLIDSFASLLKGSKKELVVKIQALLKAKKDLENKLKNLKTTKVFQSIENIDNEIKKKNGIKVLSKKVDIESRSQLRELADKFKVQIGSGIVLLGAKIDNKATLICVITKDLTKKFKAGDIVKAAARIVDGSGGGRPDMAQAGGNDPAKLDQALESVYHNI